MFNDKDLDKLRDEVSHELGDFRFRHVLGVEKEAVRIGMLYARDKIDILRAAALLHDITKELNTEKQLQICKKNGIIISNSQKMTPKIFHAITAAAIIPQKYPLFNEKEIIDAVRWHTTGRENMSICEKIIYLADYIEENRKFKDCITLRNYFWNTNPEKMTEEERLEHLDRTLVNSFDMTIKQLIDEGMPIDICTAEARNFLVCETIKTR